MKSFSTIWFEKNSIKGYHNYRCTVNRYRRICAIFSLANKITRKSIILWQLPKANTVPEPVSITLHFKIHANKLLRYVDEEGI